MGTSVQENLRCVDPTSAISCDGCVTSTLLTLDELESKTPTKLEGDKAGRNTREDYLAVHDFGASQCPLSLGLGLSIVSLSHCNVRV